MGVTVLYILKGYCGDCVHAQSRPALCDPPTVACQVPLSMRFPRQEHWSGLPVPSPMHPGLPGAPQDGLRPLVELCVEPAGLCGRCTGVAVPLRVVSSLQNCCVPSLMTPSSTLRASTSACIHSHTVPVISLSSTHLSLERFSALRI